MPAIIAHHLFGEEAYEKLSAHIGESDVAHDAFLLGNQGPDPLFCLKALPSSASYRSIATVMHEQATTALLASVHRQLVREPGTRTSPACKAYALGFLCHYLLDSTVHPLVYAQQFALCDASVQGYSREQSGDIHALIETELDEYILMKKLGATVASFSPHREILSCPREALVAISARLSAVVGNVYGCDMPRLAFASSIGLYRAAQTAIDSKRDGIRRYADYARLAGKAYLRVRAMTHSVTPNPEAPFANAAHTPWPHPFEEGRTISASFDELYDAALDATLAVIPRYAQLDYSTADCAALTDGVNFRGRRLPDEAKTAF